ncbi:hypothetical protein ACOME3_001056 [Neoechinorhynchus agilis]
MVKVAIVGCLHGELNSVYEDIELIEKEMNVQIELVLVCGDFEAIRNHQDLDSVAVPSKYRKLGDFWSYYSRIQTAPRMTIFIGGNHECSNFLTELPYGGWVAENIYYLGRSGVVNFRGIRIAGLSGIYKARDFKRGIYEVPPFTQETVRSCYHVRNLDILRLSLLNQPDVVLTHDWPRGVHRFGTSEDINTLRSQKEHLCEDMDSDALGSPASEMLLEKLTPSYWFAAHLHTNFSAVIQHSTGAVTKFLALNKVKEDYSHIRVIDIAADQGEFCYDQQWISILKQTDSMINTDPVEQTNLKSVEPESIDNDDFGDLRIPQYQQIFEWTASPSLTDVEDRYDNPFEYVPFENPQTAAFCRKFNVRDPLRLRLSNLGRQMIDIVNARRMCEKKLIQWINSEEIGQCSDLEENEEQGPENDEEKAGEVSAIDEN